MIPLTNKEIKPKNTLCYSSVMCAGRYVSLYGTISTLLLPITVQVIGGQYGELILPKTQYDPIEPNIKILSLTDMTVLYEVVLISLLFFAHLIGYFSVLKKWSVGLAFYSLVHLGETCISFFWWISVTTNHMKSYVMPQFVLGWYCVFASTIQVVSAVVVLLVTIQVMKCKKA